MTGQAPWGQGHKGPCILALGLGIIKRLVVLGGTKGQYFGLAHDNSMNCHGSGSKIGWIARGIISSRREMGHFDNPQDDGSHLEQCG